MSTNEPEPSDISGRNWVDQYYEELNHALQRFNYFLVSTAFMFLAFVTLITSCKSNDLNWIIIAVASAGIALSFYFFQINYQQTRVAHVIRELKRKTPIDPMEEDAKKLKTVCWIFRSFFDAALYIPRFRFIAKNRPASHTWIVPVLFLLLWIFSLVWWLIS